MFVSLHLHFLCVFSLFFLGLHLVTDYVGELCWEGEKFSFGENLSLGGKVVLGTLSASSFAKFPLLPTPGA